MDKQQIAQSILAKYKLQGYVPTSRQPVDLNNRFAEIDAITSGQGLKKEQDEKSIFRTILEDPLKTLLVKPAARATEAITRTIAPESLAAKGFEAMADEGQSQKILGMDIEQQKGFGEGGGKQIAGDTLKIGSYLFPYGKAAQVGKTLTGSKIAGQVASGATGGFIADVGFGLEEGQDVGEAIKPGVGTALGATIPIIAPAFGAAKAGIKKLRPVQSVDETIGKIIQGKTQDVSTAKKALSGIDTTGVKTRKDLSQKLKSAMEEQMNIVDNELGKDINVLSLDEFATRQTNKAGQEIKTDFISQALNHLEDIYIKSGDNLSASNVNLIKQKATEGLTRQEVNNIARMYSEEFGAKAFNKIGDPLTSVNAQMFESTRKALKDAARSGITGKDAATADRLYSAMSNTKKLIDKGVEGVNKLEQRIKERGLIEKLGRATMNTINTLSGGFLKGAATSVFPSNVGLKTLNWLDLEKNLVKDLKFIQEANLIKDDNALIKYIKDFTSKLKFPGDAAVDDIGASFKQAKATPNKQGGFVSLGGQSKLLDSTLSTKSVKNIQPKTAISPIIANSKAKVKGKNN